jgi:peroxiredoxin
MNAKITKKTGKNGIAIFVALILLACSANFIQAETEQKRAPDFTLKSLSGKNIKLSELRGRVILVNFWATWCAPCKEELPFFNGLYQKYKGVGLEILGVNIDKVGSNASQMSQSLSLSFPILLDSAGKVSGLYQIRSMPTTFVVGKDGTLRYTHWGFGPSDPTRYESEIRGLLRE